jgi:GNAT superfamily N-acetyltransferase
MTSEDAASVAKWMPTIDPWVRYGLTSERAQSRLGVGMARGDIVLTADLDNRKACGFGWCIPAGAFDLSPYLRWIAVHPELAGAGVGTALMAAFEQEALAHGKDMFLLAADFNVGAHRFYERQGYSQIARLPDYVVTGVSELLYWKRLR